MTVEKLIDILSKCDPKLQVRMNAGMGVWRVKSISKGKVKNAERDNSGKDSIILNM